VHVLIIHCEDCGFNIITQQSQLVRVVNSYMTNFVLCNSLAYLKCRLMSWEVQPWQRKVVEVDLYKPHVYG
jgi:hypothetical protein